LSYTRFYSFVVFFALFGAFSQTLAVKAQTPEPHTPTLAQKDCKGRTMEQKTKAFPKNFRNALYY
jgi:hypothetical protein